MEKLIQRALVDEEAMTALLTELEPFVYRVSYHLTLHQQDAEDLAQESLYKICRNLYKYRGESSLQTWVYSLVMNTFKDFYRKKRRHSSEPISDDMPVHSFESESDLRMLLTKVMDTLPEMDRRILVLRFQNDLSVRDVAAILNLTEANVKTRIFRLKETLRGFFLKGGQVL